MTPGGEEEPWIVRTTRAIARLSPKPPEAWLVIAAEKAHNAPRLRLDAERDLACWQRFRASLDGTALFPQVPARTAARAAAGQPLGASAGRGAAGLGWGAATPAAGPERPGVGGGPSAAAADPSDGLKRQRANSPIRGTRRDWPRARPDGGQDWRQPPHRDLSGSATTRSSPANRTGISEHRATSGMQSHAPQLMHVLHR